MTTLKTTIASDLTDAILDTDEFATTITYNTASIKAIVHYGARRTRGSNQAVSCDAWLEGVKASDVAMPVYRDTVVIGTNTFRVMKDDSAQPEGDGISWIIDLVRDERPVIGGRNR